MYMPLTLKTLPNPTNQDVLYVVHFIFHYRLSIGQKTTKWGVCIHPTGVFQD